MQVRGFTLVEMVMTMVVGSILILGIAGFVELGSRGYSDTVNRQRLQTQARFVLEKMTREVRHAVPNSFSTNNGCLSFYPIVYSGFYSISGENDSTLSYIVGNSQYETGNSLKMIINPTYADQFEDDDAISFTESPISLTPQQLSSQSIANRFYVYDKEGKVGYCLNDDIVTRNDEIVAADIKEGKFAYEEPTLQRGGVVHLALTFTQNDESSHFETDVQVLNVP